MDSPTPPQGHSASMPEIIVRAHLKNEITKDEQFIALGVWIADNIWKYPPESYPELAGPLVEYVRTRIDHRSDRQDHSAEKLGQWLRVMHRILGDNISNREMLVFYAEKLEAANMPELADKISRIRSRLNQYSTIHPPKVLAQAIQVQAFDVREKRQGGAA